MAFKLTFGETGIALTAVAVATAAIEGTSVGDFFNFCTGEIHEAETY